MKRPAPPNARRCLRRQQNVEGARDFRREPHHKHPHEQRVPTSERMKRAGLSHSTSATVASTSKPIQAGEPMNIRMASIN